MIELLLDFLSTPIAIKVVLVLAFITAVFAMAFGVASILGQVGEEDGE